MRKGNALWLEDGEWSTAQKKLQAKTKGEKLSNGGKETAVKLREQKDRAEVTRKMELREFLPAT